MRVRFIRKQFYHKRKNVSEFGENSLRRFRLLVCRTHRANALRVINGDFGKRVAYALMELDPRRFKAIGAIVFRRTNQAVFRRRRNEQNGPVGNNALACKLVGAPHEIGIEPTTIRLIRRRGVEETIAQNHGPALERRLNDLFNDLRARRFVHKKLACIAHRGIARIEHDAAQFIAYSGSTRLA